MLEVRYQRPFDLAALMDQVQTPGIDRAKCAKMAAFHDMGESIIGDITPSDGISRGSLNTSATPPSYPRMKSEPV